MNVRTLLTSFLTVILAGALHAGSPSVQPPDGPGPRNSGGDTPVNISGIIGSVSEKDTRRKRKKG